MEPASSKNWADKVKLGHYQLKNRLVMAAMTRQRCDPKTGIPTDLLIEYYSQRAGAGLILTECVSWGPRGAAFPGAANLYTNEQKQGWKKVVDGVHQKNGLIYAQIFHGGRSCLKSDINGLEPWSSSAIKIRDLNFFEQCQYDTPHQMTLEEIQQTKKQFRNCVNLSKQAGFDGIQLHGAHGYLVDQFLRSGVNKRTDKYGGSADNRCRFAIELIDIALQVFKPYQIGIKISPVSRYGDMYDDNPEQTFVKLAQLLEERKIGFIEARQSNQPVGSTQSFPKIPLQQIKDVCQLLKPHFSGHLIPNEQLDSITGLQKIRSGVCELVSIGRAYVANPDLAERFINNLEINPAVDWITFFRGPDKENLEAKGYTDYQFYDEWKKQQKA